MSVAAALAVHGDRDAHLTYTYKNSVRHGIADADMSDHDGAADLDIQRATGNVAGTYFNARPRRGTRTLRRA